MDRNRESGQALVFAGVALVVLLGFVGLGIDMGILRYQRRVQQTAADAAALAEAYDLGAGGVNTPAAQNSAANNGFSGATVQFSTACPTSVTGTTVTVNNPPLSGPHASGANSANYVEVCVATLQPTYFMQIFGVTTKTVSARAVATNYSGATNGNSNYNCLITLGPPTAAIEGVNLNGSGTLNAPTCGIADNGNYNTKGNALTVSAGSFGVSGTNIVKGGGGTVTCTSGQTSCPQAGTPSVGDPLSGLAVPCSPCASGTFISIDGNGNFSGSGAANVSYNAATHVYTIQPGTYSGINIQGTGSGNTVNFAPGTYVIDGSTGCNASCISIPGNATVTGTGVSFYFANTATWQTNGTPQITLSAPTSGTYSGILMYQDKTDTNVGPNPNGPTIGGNNTSTYSGVLYFPSDQVTFYGNSTTTGSGLTLGVVISDSMALSGTPVVNLVGQAGLPGGSLPPALTLTHATLVE